MGDSLYRVEVTFEGRGVVHVAAPNTSAARRLALRFADYDSLERSSAWAEAVPRHTLEDRADDADFVFYTPDGPCSLREWLDETEDDESESDRAARLRAALEKEGQQRLPVGGAA